MRKIGLFLPSMFAVAGHWTFFWANPDPYNNRLRRRTRETRRMTAFDRATIVAATTYGMYSRVPMDADGERRLQHQVQDAIERAELVERERCARVAEMLPADSTLHDAANAIRRG
jgi:hypothetical protein